MTMTTLAKTNRFEIEAEIDVRQRLARLRLTGSINEDVNFGGVIQFLNEHKPDIDLIDLDLDGVASLNSCGVRDWLLFLERAQRVAPCRFSHLSEIFIEQANLVPDMLGKPGTEVIEFVAPFYCESCRRRSLCRIETAQITLPAQAGPAGELQPPAFACPTCSKRLQFDGLSEEYLSFLNHSRLKPKAKAS